MAPNRLLVVLILSTGRVEQRLVECERELTDDELVKLRSSVNHAATGEIIAEAIRALGRVGEETEPDLRDTAQAVAASLVEAMSDHRSDERVAVGGTATLARFGADRKSGVEGKGG